MDHVLEKEIDILAITETWLREGDAALVTELTPSGYVFQHITREARNEEEDHDRIRRGGGVGILIRKNIKHELVKKENSYQSFEMIEMKIYVQNKSIRIVNIYRPQRLYNGDLSWGTSMVNINSFLAEHLASTEENKGNQKGLNKVLNTLLERKNDMKLPDRQSDRDLAERFAEYFTSKIVKIRTQIKSSIEPREVGDHYTDRSEDSMIVSFLMVTDEDVEKIIRQLPLCSLDFLPTWLMKEQASLLAQY
ncbi:hypothetical protein CAPTEDRAFT_200006 [Capitella teleta]|uniref:Uncharacterized protein n=1 Tax=Capitella teleta TaxID=283909 RepID=R7TDC4_CAPTE|nr:hypothetical protein CAPTEDRAFT_200006 [Capitella teleta]|eukprot:ELT89066.1 hypothetical protein CAPTEDRAFT_200006 [Capitella teleta]